MKATEELERHMEMNRRAATFALVSLSFARAQAEEIDRLRLSAGWIAVSEHLPEANGEYLVCIKPLLDKQSIVKLSVYEKQASPVISGFNYAPVTHWMPLPDAIK